MFWQIKRKLKKISSIVLSVFSLLELSSSVEYCQCIVIQFCENLFDSQVIFHVLLCLAWVASQNSFVYNFLSENDNKCQLEAQIKSKRCQNFVCESTMRIENNQNVFIFAKRQTVHTVSDITRNFVAFQVSTTSFLENDKKTYVIWSHRSRRKTIQHSSMILFNYNKITAQIQRMSKLNFTMKRKAIKINENCQSMKMTWINNVRWQFSTIFIHSLFDHFHFIHEENKYSFIKKKTLTENMRI